MTMAQYLIHWTAVTNLTSIAATGLDPQRATSGVARVWMTTPTLTRWAQAHVADRHDWRPSDMVCLFVDVTDLRLYGFSRPGVFYAKEVVPAHLVRVREGSGRGPGTRLEDFLGRGFPPT